MYHGPNFSKFQLKNEEVLQKLDTIDFHVLLRIKVLQELDFEKNNFSSDRLLCLSYLEIWTRKILSFHIQVFKSKLAS